MKHITRSITSLMRTALSIKSIAAILSLMALSGAHLEAFASGGDGSSTLVSTSHIQPEPQAMKSFLNGHLGILWPGYDRRVLMMAYRQALGLAPLSDSDTKKWLAAADASIKAMADLDAKEAKGDKTPPTPESPAQGSLGLGSALDDWAAARKSTGLAAPAYQLAKGWRPKSSYTYADNCLPAAFAMATKTLNARMRAYGNDSPSVLTWVAGQDAVFSQCEPGDKIVRLPVPKPPSAAPKWLVQDLAYQNAASLLYQNKLDDAAQAFAAIAKDSSSPWQDWASYLEVRIWWRQTFNGPEDFQKFMKATPDWDKHPMALKLRQIEASAKDSEVKTAAHGLYDSMVARYTPEAVSASLWEKMNAPAPVANLDEWVAEDRWLWALMSEKAADKDWLYVTRSQPALPYSKARYADESTNAVAIWKEKKSQIWLASALMSAGMQTPSVDEMLAASRLTKRGEPLYLHFAWQRTRIAISKRDFTAARAELEAVRESLKSESLGTRQAFDQMEMLSAPSLSEVAGHLVRTAVGADYLGSGEPDTLASMPKSARENLLDDETRAWVMRQLSGKEILALADDSKLPTVIKLQLAGEAWHWGAFLPDPELERAAIKRWAELAGNKPLAAAAGAESLDEARFLMARALLLKTVTRVYTAEQGTPALGFAEVPKRKQGVESAWEAGPSFHNAAFQSEQDIALATLAKSNETTWMGQQILPWMQSHPKFAAGPAILEKLVYASRYGMNDKATSKKAFQLLHQQYPNSSEAGRTRYYY